MILFTEVSTYVDIYSEKAQWYCTLVKKAGLKMTIAEVVKGQEQYAS